MIGEVNTKERRYSEGVAAPGVDDIYAQPGPQLDFLSSSADIVVYGGSAGGGKCLHVETPIPTPRGFKWLRDLRVGDFVYGWDGKPTEITYCSGEMLDHVCYKLTFDDGEEVIADSEHLWWTYTLADLHDLTTKTDEKRAKRRANRPSRSTGGKSLKFTQALQLRNKLRAGARKPEPTGAIISTQEILDTLKVRGRTNHAVPVAGAVEGEHVAHFHVDPYLLGAWLGDGTTCSGGYTTADLEMAQAFRDGGYLVKKWKDKYGYGINGLMPRLRDAGVLNNKHIPQQYLGASAEQRLALLQGLMDTDGTTRANNGGVSFTSTRWELITGVRELVCSLGWKAGAIHAKRSFCNGKECATAYTFCWSADKPVFRLKRKLDRQKIDGHRRTVNYRYIVSCERVESVPVCCIKIANSDGIFLAGWGFIPTHNTFGLLMEAARHIDNPDFGAVIFRRTYPEVVTPGGLWPESFKIYPHLTNIAPNESKLKWTFPSGATVRFAHMQHAKNVLNWLGSQITLIGFDQLETFEESQFWYLVSRNRSMSGIAPYLRATANPQPGWLADLLAWWIDQTTGYPIPERSGVIRWLVRLNDMLEWGDSWEDLHTRFPEAVCPFGVDPDGKVEKRAKPKSLTFIPAKLTDNPKLMEADPNYLANLQSLPRVERERLEKGNWLIGDATGHEWPQEYFLNVFFDSWSQVQDLQLKVMCLDPSKGQAGSETGGNTLDRVGDYSAWIMLGVGTDLRLWAECDADNIRQVEPMKGQPHLRSMVLDGIALFRNFKPAAVGIEVGNFQEWVAVAMQRISREMGLNIPLYDMLPRLNKQSRIRTLTPYLSGGRLKVLNNPGGRLLVQQMRVFPDKTAHDDCPDALKGAEMLADWVLQGAQSNADGISARR